MGLLPCLLLAAAVAAAPAPVEMGQTGFTLELEDQYGEPFRYPSEAEGSDGSPPVTLLVAADRKGADDRRAWAEALRERYGERIDAVPPELLILPVAHLGGVPKMFRGLIVGRFFDGEKPTGLDWQGRVEAQLGLEKGTPNLYLFDREGALVLKTAGPPDPDIRDRIFTALDDLLEITPPRRTGPSR